MFFAGSVLSKLGHYLLCTSTSNTAKNGIGCLIVIPNQAARRKRVQAFTGKEVP